MANTYEHIHQATNGDLGKMLMEYARRHVDEEKEVYLEAARRLKEDQRIVFNKESPYKHIRCPECGQVFKEFFFEGECITECPSCGARISIEKINNQLEVFVTPKS